MNRTALGRQSHRHLVLSVLLYNHSDISFVVWASTDKPADEALADFVAQIASPEFIGVWIETTKDLSSPHLDGLSRDVHEVCHFLRSDQVIAHFTVTTSRASITDEDIYACVGITPPASEEDPPPPLVLRTTKVRPIEAKK